MFTSGAPGMMCQHQQEGNKEPKSRERLRCSVDGLIHLDDRGSRTPGSGEPCCIGSNTVTKKPGRPWLLCATITEWGFPRRGQLSRGQIYHAETEQAPHSRIRDKL